MLFPLAAFAASPTEQVRGGEVEQGWFRLAQALEPFDGRALHDRCEELGSIADRFELERLTPMALSLAARARALPPEQARAMLDCAAALDPASPEVHLSRSSFLLRHGEAVAGMRALLQGSRALLADRRLASVVGPTSLLALLVSVSVGFALWAALATRRALVRLWHDLSELWSHWRLGPNGFVLAALVLTLPLFAAGDVALLALWVFAGCWAYFSSTGKTIGVAGLLLVAATPSLSELAFRSLTHPPNPILRASTALADRRYEPQLLEELAFLSDVFVDSPEFYRLQGDLYRQFGLHDAAAWSYREGLRLAPGNGPLSVALGVVRYLEGDFNAALQSFQAARAAGYDPVVVNYDLSLTFAETYHFRESDDAINLAREADESRLRRLTTSRDHQPILPTFTRSEAESLLAQKDQLVLLNRGLLRPPLVRERTITHPLTIAAFAALIVAIGHFLLRDRATGFALACLKCGRPFCRRCKLSQESQSYCTQCVNIFLKKDMVPIDAQVAKRKQLSRHQLALRLERRVADLVLPGLGLGFAGRPLLGGCLAAVALLSSTVALVWLPAFIGPALQRISLWPLMATGGGLWLVCAILAQAIHTERR